MQAMSSSYQTSQLQIKDFTNLRFVSEAFGFGEAGAMLSDREKLILHFVSVITIAKMTNMPNYEQMLETMIGEVRKNRCRSLNDDDIAVLLKEVNEEMICGKIMFQHLVEDQISSTYCPVFDGTGRMVQKSGDTEPCITCGKSKKDHNFKEMSDCEWSMTGERPNKNANWRDMR
uniref:Uncharacterized protein n=1 Tax=uncultured marine thaumarchaeote KM3_67_E02 TaxID=1456235 RepID=A0A075HKQ2_9ARCH|nr:hypothetical protein [uncultured marine thaumarchaeote KM3_67_E02]